MVFTQLYQSSQFELDSEGRATLLAYWRRKQAIGDPAFGRAQSVADSYALVVRHQITRVAKLPHPSMLDWRQIRAEDIQTALLELG